MKHDDKVGEEISAEEADMYRREVVKQARVASSRPCSMEFFRPTLMVSIAKSWACLQPLCMLVSTLKECACRFAQRSYT